MDEATAIALEDLDLKDHRIRLRRLKNGLGGEKPLWRHTAKLLRAHLRIRRDAGPYLFTGPAPSCYSAFRVQRLKVDGHPSEEPLPQSNEGQTKSDPDRSVWSLSGTDKCLRSGLMPNFSEAFVNVALCLPLIHPHRVVLLPSRGLRSHKIDTWTSGPYVFSMPSAFPTFQQYAL